MKRWLALQRLTKVGWSRGHAIGLFELTWPTDNIAIVPGGLALQGVGVCTVKFCGILVIYDAI